VKGSGLQTVAASSTNDPLCTSLIPLSMTVLQDMPDEPRKRKAGKYLNI
jgi:hypothetical protein